MARSLNKIMLIGHVGQDPEIKEGTHPMAKFSIATSRKWKGANGEYQEKTEWHNCTAWGKLVGIIGQWVKKGDLRYVEGRGEYSSTEKDGVKRYWTDINVQELSMLGKDLSKPKSKPEESKRPEGNTDPSDDLPF